MRPPKSITLPGSFIQLEPLDEIHREPLRKISRDEKTSTYSPSLRLDFDSWFNKAIKNFKEAQQLSFAVRTLSDNQIVGSTRFYNIILEHQRLTLGYTWYTPAVWGTEVNPECKFLLFQYAFETLDANRVEFNIDSRNMHSRAAVKKLGAIEEGILREHILLEDKFLRDTVVYSVIKKEWPDISLKLQERIRILKKI